MFAHRTGWKLKPNAYSAALNAARGRGERLLDLTASNPTQCNFDVDSTRILDALRDPRALLYDPQPQGLQSARQAVAEYYNSGKLSQDSHLISPDQIFLTTSTSEAYSYIFRLLCDPGDEVLIPRPSYPLFDFLADIQDVKLTAYPLQYDHGWHIDFALLESAIAATTRAVMVVHPNNPTGSFASAGEMKRLREICA